MTEQNKKTVLRFNKEVIEQGKIDALHELVADDFFNHSTPPGVSNGRDGMIYFLLEVLRKAFPDLKAEIFDQVAEGDKVVTRKAFHATHTGELFGIAPTNKKITLEVIDIIRLRDGQYVEHWGISNLQSIVAELGKK